MTATLNETKLDYRGEGATTFTCDEAASKSIGGAFESQRANALGLDQSLPRLLYELAVRMPAQPDVQALCVWLYEPVGHAIRLHVLMADLPATLGAGMGFPGADSIAG